MTQAGGTLDVRIRKMAHDYMDARGGRFHVMYGQTEAAPRITTLAHEDFAAHAETVGPALPGGRIEIIGANGVPDVEGEVIYHGPNVMMGYAETPDDLALGNDMGGRLATGDIGRLDEEGRLTITGRIKRMGKIAGLRVNLDEVERALSGLGEEFAVVGKGEVLLLFHLPNADLEALKERALKQLSDRFTLPKTAYRFQEIDVFPRTSRDKIDYLALS
jgi:acyl-CoA synthetase (AMP-forming)/AMP-acid ligase II